MTGGKHYTKLLGIADFGFDIQSGGLRGYRSGAPRSAPPPSWRGTRRSRGYPYYGNAFYMSRQTKPRERMKAAQDLRLGLVRKGGFDKTIILGIVLFVLLVVLVVSIVYGIEGLLDALLSKQLPRV